MELCWGSRLRTALPTQVHVPPRYPDRSVSSAECPQAYSLETRPDRTTHLVTRARPHSSPTLHFPLKQNYPARVQQSCTFFAPAAAQLACAWGSEASPPGVVPGGVWARAGADLRGGVQKLCHCRGGETGDHHHHHHHCCYC